MPNQTAKLENARPRNSSIMYEPYAVNEQTIAERLRCRVGQFWPKIEDDILQTV